MGGSKKGSTVVGYRYLMSLHMGICRGPVDEVSMVKVGDQRAWPLGAESPVNDTAVTSINAPNLFGGDKKEGGVSGEFSVMMGKEDQISDVGLMSLLPGLVPGWRGIVSIFFDGLICSLNPYPKTWKFRVVRNLKGWDGPVWHPEIATVMITDEGNPIRSQNGAHILYECSTNRVWGRGLPRTRLDEESFTSAALTLYNEGFGLCMKWGRQDSLDKFVKNVIDHIGGVLRISRVTGLLELKLIRNDYNPEDLPLYTYDTGLLEVLEDEIASKDNIVNEVVVSFMSTEAEGKRQVRVHNLASIQSNNGAINSTTTEYVGICSADLAIRVAQRDLKANSASGRRYKVKVDRRGWRLAPGDVFRISAPDRGIQNAILRIGKTKDTGTGDGGIDIEGIVDVFGLAETSFIQPQSPGWIPPNNNPLPVLHHVLKEASYRDIFIESRNSLSDISDTSGAIMSIGAKPSSMSMAYDLWTHADGEDYEDRDTAVFAPVGILDGNLSVYNNTIKIKLGTDLPEIRLGTAFMIDAEIFRLDAITLGAGSRPTLATLTAGRACVDTLPATHVSGAKVYFYERAVGYDGREYGLSEVVYGKMTTRTSTGVLDLNDAPQDSVSIQARQARPYPPGKLRVNTIPFGNVINATAPFLFTWTHRDRVIQQDQLFDHEAASMGPETGVTYGLQIHAIDGTVLRTVVGITADNWTYDQTMLATDGNPTNFVFHLWSVRAGIYCGQQYWVPIHRV